MLKRHAILFSVSLGLILTCQTRVPGQAGTDDTGGVTRTEANVEAPEEFREQTIYIPYEKLQRTFEREGRGVFLPYEKFQELWKAARGCAKQASEN